MEARGTSAGDEFGGVGFIVRRRRYWYGPIWKADKVEICNNLSKCDADERHSNLRREKKCSAAEEETRQNTCALIPCEKCKISE